MNKEYTQPEFKSEAFNCPFCEAYSNQKWDNFQKIFSGRYYFAEIDAAICSCCDLCSLWVNDKMVYPKILTSESPHSDMPESVKELYEEARNVCNDSPRAAAALLRVSLEKLTEELGETKGDLNSRIGNLKKRGISETVINSLDIVRVVGNEGGSHAGQIDLTGADNLEIVETLFWLINYIVEQTITNPKEISKRFNSLPANKIQGINDRDAN